MEETAFGSTSVGVCNGFGNAYDLLLYAVLIGRQSIAESAFDMDVIRNHIVCGSAVNGADGKGERLCRVHPAGTDALESIHGAGCGNNRVNGKMGGLRRDRLFR